MLQTLAAVIPLSIAAAISPVVLMVGIALLDGARPRVQTGAYAIGVSATTILLFALGFVASHLQRDGLEPGFLGSRWAYLAIGVFLIAAAAILVVKRPNPHQADELTDRLLTGDRRPTTFALAGVVVMITNASSFVVLIAIIHSIGQQRLPIIEEGVAFAIAALIVSLPGTIPFLTALLGSESRRERLQRIGNLAVRYGPIVMAFLWLLFGALNVMRFLNA